MTRHNSSLVVWYALFFSLHSSFSFLPPFDASFVLRAHCTHNWTIWIIISVYAWKSTFPKCSHRIFSCFRLDCNKIDTKRENWDTYMHVSLHNKRFATLWMEIALLLFVAAAVHVCVPSNFFFLLFVSFKLLFLCRFGSIHRYEWKQGENSLPREREMVKRKSMQKQ